MSFYRLILPLSLAAFLVLAVDVHAEGAASAYTVAPQSVQDRKAVFATVESRNVVPARARINGTVAELSVREGDVVKQGQVLGVIADEKLALQIRALDSRIHAYDAQILQLGTDLGRIKKLVPVGSVAQSVQDRAQGDYDVAFNSRKSLVAERDVLTRQIDEGRIEAPVAGRVLSVPVTAGTVMMPGETLATLAEENYILRLDIPERHARAIKPGDTVTADAAELGGTDTAAPATDTGQITLVYPQIEQGRVRADAVVKGTGDYYVGERVRVWISAGTRQAIVIPAGYVTTRFGMDLVRLKAKDGAIVEVPVQTGRVTEEGVEILSGLNAGDVVVRP